MRDEIVPATAPWRGAFPKVHRRAALHDLAFIDQIAFGISGT
jgi:hypothetical protein